MTYELRKTAKYLYLGLVTKKTQNTKYIYLIKTFELFSQSTRGFSIVIFEEQLEISSNVDESLRKIE